MATDRIPQRSSTVAFASVSCSTVSRSCRSRCTRATTVECRDSDVTAIARRRPISRAGARRAAARKRSHRRSYGPTRSSAPSSRRGVGAMLDAIPDYLVLSTRRGRTLYRLTGRLASAIRDG